MTQSRERLNIDFLLAVCASFILPAAAYTCGSFCFLQEEMLTVFQAAVHAVTVITETVPLEYMVELGNYLGFL